MQRYSHSHTTSIAGTGQTDMEESLSQKKKKKKANLTTHEVQHATTAVLVQPQLQTEKKIEPLIVGSLYSSHRQQVNNR